jgi:hypothetical protein
VVRGAAAPLAWATAQTALDAAFFDGIRMRLAALPRDSWPSLAALNAMAASHGILNIRGCPVRFVPPTAGMASAMDYETQIAGSGNVPTRDNWHDLFNALQWLAFPQMKAMISHCHAELLGARGATEARSRSVPRDVLTMVDESGILVASADDTLLELIRHFRWRELFVDRRQEVRANMRVVLIGHGLMEKSLAPFIGITAKAVLLNIGNDVPLDAAAARWLDQDANLQSSQNLAPLPLLGIPGWDARNEDPAFYSNERYFRSGRRPGK